MITDKQIEMVEDVYYKTLPKTYWNWFFNRSSEQMLLYLIPVLLGEIKHLTQKLKELENRKDDL